MKNILHTSNIKSLKKIYQGKVRDVYEVDHDHLLIISTDRVSVFDIILPTPIPEKGIILNNVSNFWFKKFNNIINNHLSGFDVSKLKISDEEYNEIEGRFVIAKKLEPVPIESIVRNYLIGSGYSDYITTGKICGIDLPENLKMASKLPNLIFTPSSKAALGDHDVNISFEEMREIRDRLKLSEEDYVEYPKAEGKSHFLFKEFPITIKIFLISPSFLTLFKGLFILRVSQSSSIMEIRLIMSGSINKFLGLMPFSKSIIDFLFHGQTSWQISQPYILLLILLAKASSM